MDILLSGNLYQRNRRTCISRIITVIRVTLMLCLGTGGVVYGSTSEYDIIGAVGYNARTIALGGCLGAITSDVDTIFLNPAGIGRFNSQEINLSYNRWVNGMSYESVGYIAPIGGMTLGLNAIYQNPMGENPSTDNFSSRNLALSMSAGKKLDESIMLGANVKAIQEEVDGQKQNSLVVDLAGLYNIGIIGLTVGFGVQNIGSRIKELSNGGELPLTFNLGGTYSTLGDSLFLGLDLNIIDEGVVVNSGIEYMPFSFLSLRTGYRAMLVPGGGFNSFSRLSTGFGLNIFKFHVDYAYVYDGSTQDDHIFSVRFKVMMEPFGVKSPSPDRYAKKLKKGKKRSCITIDGVTMCLYND